MTSRIILASASPRRRELLSGLGLAFTVQPSDVDESAIVAAHAGPPAPSSTGHVPPIRGSEEPSGHLADLVMALALAKAADIARHQTAEALVIGADTVVVLDNDILGKPTDQEDAVSMLMRLSGRVHEVYTGIAVVEQNAGGTVRERTDYAMTHVEFVPFTEDVARRYAATGEPMDKAGSYGIQTYGALLVARIDGDYFNVVGLPLVTLARVLEEFGVRIW